MSDRIESLARDEADALAARGAIWAALGNSDGYRIAYAALCRWTWRAMIERRLDEDLRDWHRLLLDTAAKISVGEAGHAPGAGKLAPKETAQRMRALADLVRLSIDAAKAADAEELAGRAHVLEILRLLAGKVGEFVRRDEIQAELGLGNANLSRVMSLLALNGLVEREARGRAAAFRATQRALRFVDAACDRLGHLKAEAPPVTVMSAPEPSKTEHYEYSFVITRSVIRDTHVVRRAYLRGKDAADADEIEQFEPVFSRWLRKESLLGDESVPPAPAIPAIRPEFVN